MNDQPTETIEQRQQRLKDELEQLELQQREQAEHERQLEQAARQAELSPELKAQAAELEQIAQAELDREYPPPWKPAKPEEGHPQQLVGQVDRIDPSIGPSPTYGTYSAVIEITTTAAEHFSIWAQHDGVIFNQMRRLRLQPGDLIAVRHLGMKKSDASGFEYRNYKLVRLGDNTGADRVDYDHLTKQAGDQAALPAPAGDDTEADDDIPF